jgi:MFS family permease
MSNHQRNYILFLIAGSGLVAVARAMTLSFLAIKLQQSFGLGPAVIGAILGAGPLVGALTAPFAGAMSDKVGRKTIMTITLISMALALVGMGTAETVLAFCVAQIGGAVAVAVYEPISRAMMSDACPEPQRLKYFSWRYTAANVGWAVGPLIGIAAGAASTFLFVVAGAMYALFALALHLYKTPVMTTSRTDQQTSSLSLFETVKTAARDPRLAFFIGGGTLLIAVYGQFSATLAPYLAANFEGGVEIFAYMLSINGVVVLVGNPFARRFIERTGALRALVIGCMFFCAGEIGYLLSGEFWAFAISIVIFTIGEILVVPSEYMLVDGISNDRNRGSYFGAHSFSTVGNFVGPTLGGALLGMLGGPAMFLLFAGMAVASAILFTIGTKMPPPAVRSKGLAPTSPALLQDPKFRTSLSSQSVSTRLGHRPAW